MGIAGRVIGTLAGAAGVAAAGGALRLVRRRHRINLAAGEAFPFGSLRSTPVPYFVTPDGVSLNVEVDEADSEVTLVFVHGFSLTLDAWHFQRAAFRGLSRAVFYDQRCHGSSGRGDRAHSTMEQLADDLKQVIDVTSPDRPVVLVGHSMGGMTIAAFVDRYPEMIGTKVLGAALIATTAGAIDVAKILIPLIPAKVGSTLTLNTVRTLARGHRAVDGVRRRVKTIAAVITDVYGFGSEVPASYVTFLDSMLTQTPFQVVAEFYDGFRNFDRIDQVAVLSAVPTTIICGTADKLTPMSHSHALATRITGSTLIECPGAGHMVILERYGQVNAALDQLLSAARVARS